MNYKFTGKESDKESDLSYFDARYLDSKAGAFVSVDPKLSESISDSYIKNYPRRLNLYQYGSNNPLVYIDPTGELDWKLSGDGLLGISTGVLSVMGGIVAAATLVSLPVSTGVLATTWTVAKGVAGVTAIISGTVGVGLSTAQVITGSMVKDSPALRKTYDKAHDIGSSSVLRSKSVAKHVIRISLEKSGVSKQLSDLAGQLVSFGFDTRSGYKALKKFKDNSNLIKNSINLATKHISHTKSAYKVADKYSKATSKNQAHLK